MLHTPERSRMAVCSRFRRAGIVLSTILALFATLGLVHPGTARAQHADAKQSEALAPDTVVPSRHPEPRPGISADRVLAAERLVARPDAARVFNMVRQIPHIFDGIHCWCGCHERSLLSCYEGEEAMGRYCGACQAQAELVYRLSKDGKTLEQIRAAIDAEFGP